MSVIAIFMIVKIHNLVSSHPPLNAGRPGEASYGAISNAEPGSQRVLPWVVPQADHPKIPAKNPTGDLGQFTNFTLTLATVSAIALK